MWLSLPSLHTLLEYGSAVSRQRLNLMLVLQHHLTTLPKRVSDQGGVGNEVVHSCWTVRPLGRAAWAELSQRHRTERCKARAMHGTKRRESPWRPHVPGQAGSAMALGILRWPACSAVPGSRFRAPFPSPPPQRAMSGIAAINVTACQDRLQQNPNKQNNRPADKVIHKKQSF